jgi:hypothetical protein
MTDRSHNLSRICFPIFVVTATSALNLLTASQCYADENVDKGETIAREAERRDRGWGDSQAQAIMILEDIGGNTRERRLRLSTLERRGDNQGDKSLVVFDEPRDIKGTALLSYTRILEPDDQWLFLPALKRVKRISSANKSGSFVGSEFAYEDITGQEFEKYTYKWLLDEPCDLLECFVVERRPRYAPATRGWLRGTTRKSIESCVSIISISTVITSRRCRSTITGSTRTGSGDPTN